MRGNDIPNEAIRNTLKTYHELHAKFNLFLDGRLSNLLVIARSGVGKSYYLKSRADERITAILEGNLRPLATYISLHKNKHKLVILGDAETLWATTPGRIIIRELTDTSFPKTISWNSTVKALKQTATPSTFQTNSRVCLVCNTFRFGRSDETAAILDRCQCYYFDPLNSEVAKYVAQWFWDQEVMDYVLDNLECVDGLTARMMEKASERKRHGDPNWQKETPSLAKQELIVQRIHQLNLKTSKERLDVFFEQTTQAFGSPLSRATYMRIQARLKERSQLHLAPKLNLQVTGKRKLIPEGRNAILNSIRNSESSCMRPATHAHGLRVFFPNTDR